MQCTFKLEKSEEENSETERSRISEESKKEARRKSQTYTRHTIVKANTLLSMIEIGGRITIKHSKEFPRILNSLRSLREVDLWLFLNRNVTQPMRMENITESRFTDLHAEKA